MDEGSQPKFAREQQKSLEDREWEAYKACFAGKGASFSFDENEWKELYKLSEKTFVDESDTLKQGAAGAGLTDND